MNVFAALKTEGTTAVSDIATETKQADALALPSWFSEIFRGFYAARNDKTVSAVAGRWHIIKG